MLIGSIKLVIDYRHTPVIPGQITRQISQPYN
jgi:hypothetical protein